MFTKIKEKIFIPKNIIICLFLLTLLVGLSAVSLYRYQSWQIFYYDFGYFARIIWKLSRFKTPIINHISFGRILFLGDHFSPSLILLAPLLWITSSPTVLLIEQALVIVLTGSLFYVYTRKLHLKWLQSAATLGAYLVFTGTLSPLISDWHPEPTAAFFLLLFIFLTQFSKKNWLAVVTGLIFVGFKESNGVIMIIVSLWLALIKKEKRKMLFAMVVFSLLWFLVTTKIFIPSLAGKYHYLPSYPKSLSELTAVINHPQKISVVKKSLLSFGLLPLLAPGWLVLSLTELATRYLPVSSIFQNFSLGMHYQVYFSLFLALSTAYGIKNWNNFTFVKDSKLKNLLKIIPAAILTTMSLYSARRLTASPVNMMISPVIWRQLSWKKDFREKFISQLPRDESIMAPNNILPRFYNQHAELYLLQEGYPLLKPKNIIIDLTSGQNPNNFYGPNGAIDLNFVKQIQKTVEDDHCYDLQQKSGDLYWFVRINC